MSTTFANSGLDHQTRNDLAAEHGDAMADWIMMISRVPCLARFLINPVKNCGELNLRLRSLARSKGASVGERQIATLCIGIYEGRMPIGKDYLEVNPIDLIASADEATRLAVAQWVADPFWP